MNLPPSYCSSNLSRTARRGFALFLVMTALGVAFVLGIAVLANTTVQSQLSLNYVDRERADALAQSGVELAIYYLLNPASAPSLGSGGYYSGESGITLTGMSGTLTTAVSLTAGTMDEYDITSSAAAASGGAMRTITARVQITNTPLQWGMASNGNLTIPAAFDIVGGLTGSNRFTIASGATVTGAITATNGGTSNSANASAPGPLVSQGSPSELTGSISDYRSYEYFNGSTWITGTATDITSMLSGSTLGSGTPIILTPDITSANPAGVYYVSQSITLGSNVTINGTLLVNGGNLTLSGTGDTITAASGFPGLIVTGSLLQKNGSNLTVNGITCVGSMTNSGVCTSAVLKINGALIMGSSNPSLGSFMSHVTITYTANSVNVPHLGTINDTVKILAWAQ